MYDVSFLSLSLSLSRSLSRFIVKLQDFRFLRVRVNTKDEQSANAKKKTRRAG